MEQWCIWLLGLMALPAQTANAIVSWALDKIPGLRELWEKQLPIVKMVILAVLTGGIGYGCYQAATAFGCADIPEHLGYLYTLLMAALGIFIGGKRHEAEKRAKAEAEVERLQAEVARLERLLKHGE